MPEAEPLDPGQEPESEPAPEQDPNVTPDEGEEPQEGESQPEQAAQPDPYQSRFDALEQRNRELEATLKRLADGQSREQPRREQPRWMGIPRNQWNENDLVEYMDHVNSERFNQFKEEQVWRSQLNATALGAGADYDTVVQQYVMDNPKLNRDPQQMNFIRQMTPLAQYMLGLVHEMAAKSDGDPIKLIKALRNGMTARTDTHKEIQKALTKTGREVQLGVFKGGRQQAASSGSSAWDGSDEEWLNRTRNRRG